MIAVIAWIIGFSVAMAICLTHYLVNERPYENEPLEFPEPFIVSEYYARMEQAALETLESQAPVDQTIILWWGLDGLRLNEDGTMEWVSRRKPRAINQDVFYQSCQSLQDTAIISQLRPPMPGNLECSIDMQPTCLHLQSLMMQCCCTTKKQP